MFKKNLVLSTIAMGGLSLALALGSSACSSSGSGTGGTGNGFADSVVGSAQGAETEGALLSLIDGSGISATDVTPTPANAATAYANAIDDACAVADGAVVTITFPCDTFMPNITSGELTVTFSNPATVTIDTTETLNSENGAELTISTTAVWSSGTDWSVDSTSEVKFGDSTSTSDGSYDITTGDPCSDIYGETTVSLDVPELDGIPGVDALVFAITYGEGKDSYSVCNDGTCPSGTVSIGSTGFTFSMVYDGTTSATATIDVTGQASQEIPVTLQCTARE